MCGICGLYMMESAADLSILHNMADAMVHRGPDDGGFFLDENIGLGFRRLSIVDIQNGHQPMSNETGSIWVVFNGEIYNHEILRNTLLANGHQFKSCSDTEVIVHLYEEYGMDCLSQLEGMFAFGILDLRTRTLYLARDHFGIKPLYYARSSRGFVFASELKSLLRAGVVLPKVNPQALWDYCTFQYVPSATTMIQDVFKLPPAHYLQYQNGRLSLVRYWTPEFNPDYGKPMRYFVDGVQHYLESSVKRHLQGSVPIGSFLSSGVDSGAIASLARKHQPLLTFSVGFQDAQQTMNELDDASKLAEILGSSHRSLLLSTDDFMEQLPKAIEALEEPLGDPSAIALYCIAELARQHVTVVLSGEGADEIFGGYPIYLEPRSLAPFRLVPQSVRSMIGQFATHLPYQMKGRGYLLRGSQAIERRFVGNIRVFAEDVKHELIQMNDLSQPPLSSYRLTDPIYQSSIGFDPMTRMQLVDLNTWLPGDILFKADKMTMAHSLELRVPFLDKPLFDFASTIPASYRYRDYQQKFVLREAMRTVLPTSVTHRPKLGFPVPYRTWLRERFDLVWDTFNASPARIWFDQQKLKDMLDQHRTGKRDYGRELWTIFAFLMWHRMLEGYGLSG